MQDVVEYSSSYDILNSNRTYLSLKYLTFVLQNLLLLALPVGTYLHNALQTTLPCSHMCTLCPSGLFRQGSILHHFDMDCTRMLHGLDRNENRKKTCTPHRIRPGYPVRKLYMYVDIDNIQLQLEPESCSYVIK